MKTKRKTASEKEAAGKAALRLRLRDMLRGAHGGYSADIDAEDGAETPSMLGVDTFGRWMGAIEQTFVLPDDTPCEIEGLRRWRLGFNNLSEFDTLDSATEYLWNSGARP